jgi:ectonucleotide pyrophosphatase/phosphodiesterase family protein 6
MGLSGYDPSMEDMRGIFLAQGPDFKNNGEEVAPMELVDVYQVLAYVLKIPPNPHNGTWSHVRGLLLGEPGSAACSKAGLVLTLLAASLVTLGAHQ